MPIGRFIFIVTLICVPGFSHAQVLINEVAWMGTKESHTDEWIELYNAGDAPASLAGWTLSDNASLEIELDGTLAPGAYAVLERTNDASAPGDAFLIYTGALSNEGRTLTLRGADGSVIDEVPGGANWEKIGGDNAAKHTAQWTESGWVTAPPTPGGPNIAPTARSPAPRASQTAAPAPALSDREQTPQQEPTPIARISAERPTTGQAAQVIAAQPASAQDAGKVVPYVLFAGVVMLGILGIYSNKWCS